MGELHICWAEPRLASCSCHLLLALPSCLGSYKEEDTDTMLFRYLVDKMVGTCCRAVSLCTYVGHVRLMHGPDDDQEA